MTNPETIKACDLIGQTVTLKVLQTPCRCVYDGTFPLTETETGIIRRFKNMPGGPIGFLESADDGAILCFDLSDTVNGRIQIEI